MYAAGMAGRSQWYTLVRIGSTPADNWDGIWKAKAELGVGGGDKIGHDKNRSIRSYAAKYQASFSKSRIAQARADGTWRSSYTVGYRC